MKIQLSKSQFLLLKEALPFWCEQFAFATILNSNAIASACNYDTYDLVAGVAQSNTKIYNHLNELETKSAWKLGYIGYEYNHLKHGLQELKVSGSGFSGCFFFEPQILLIATKGSTELEIIGADESIINEILNYKISNSVNSEIKLNSRVSKEEYIQNVERIKEQIVNGDYYELNYCMEYFADNAWIQAPAVFQKLLQISPTPFATYFKQFQNYLLCASPERFLKRTGNKIIAQPIKGTIHRSSDIQEDEVLKNKLKNSEKERAENIMIVDLMRNDLARCAEVGSVKVEELLKVYSFATVHQLISTITANLRENISFEEIMNYTFPMGSMTGAPKREVMHNIDNYEKRTRGIFSGTVGYISPENDFDLNVVIRSIVYNAKNKHISCHVGSAITFDADAESEYEECLLKAGTMFKALNALDIR